MKFSCIMVALLSAVGVFSAETSGIGSPYGMCSHVSRRGFRESAAEQYRLFNEIGVRYVRTDFDWMQVGAKDGVWNFSSFDSMVGVAKEYGITILPILGSMPPARYSPIYKHIPAFQEYVKQTVGHFRKELPYWEVINEHNISRQVDKKVSEYNIVLNETYRTIKSLAPECPVLYGGTMGIPWAYLEESLKKGAQFDRMNLHPYTIGSYPEFALAENIRSVGTLMKKYGYGDRKIWVTEYGYATAEPFGWTKAFLPEALKQLKLEPEKTVLTVFDDPDQYFCSIIPNNERELPRFHAVNRITLNGLKHLDPGKYPLLLSPEGEAFPLQYVDDLLRYVRNGGTLVLINGAPFYYDWIIQSDGSVRRPVLGLSVLKKFRLDWGALPDQEKSEKTELALDFRLPDSIPYVKTNRYVSGKNLKTGDVFQPIAWSVTKSGKKYPLGGIYRFSSDFKGNIIYSLGPAVRQCSEFEQGCLLPRAYLLMLSAGVEKVFWYRFLDSPGPATEAECCFGLIRPDFSRKDSFFAYRTLAAMCPPNSSRPVISKRNGVFLASWDKPDGSKVYALWSVNRNLPLKLAVSGKSTNIMNYLGKTVSFPSEATPGIVYLTGPDLRISF